MAFQPKCCITTKLPPKFTPSQRANSPLRPSETSMLSIPSRRLAASKLSPSDPSRFSTKYAPTRTPLAALSHVLCLRRRRQSGFVGCLRHFAPATATPTPAVCVAFADPQLRQGFPLRERNGFLPRRTLRPDHASRPSRFLLGRIASYGQESPNHAENTKPRLYPRPSVRGADWRRARKN